MSTEDDKIKAIAKKAEVDEQTVRDRLDEEIEDFRSRMSSSISDEDLRSHALSVVRNELQNFNSGGGGFVDGDAESIPVLTVGYQEKESDYWVTTGNGILGAGIINPSNDPAGFCTFVLDEDDGVDLDFAAESFEPLNTIRANVAKRQVGSWDDEPTVSKGGQPTYVAESGDDTTFEIVSPADVSDDDPIADLPEDREAKREMINEHFITDEEAITLQNYAEHETLKNSNGFEVAFGADVKRIRGEVADAIVWDSGDGSMTVTDDTIFSKDDVPDELIGDQQRTPGLQVMANGDLIYDERSIVDIYGFIEQRDDGQYRMQALGVIPIIEFEYDDSGSSGGTGGEDDPADEDTI